MKNLVFTILNRSNDSETFTKDKVYGLNLEENMKTKLRFINVDNFLSIVSEDLALHGGHKCAILLNITGLNISMTLYLCYTPIHIFTLILISIFYL